MGSSKLPLESQNLVSFQNEVGENFPLVAGTVNGFYFQHQIDVVAGKKSFFVEDNLRRGLIRDKTTTLT